MKKLLLGTLLLLSTISFGQINTNDLIGYWQPSQKTSELFFWKDVDGKLQVQEISSITGDPLDTISLRVNDNSVFIRAIYLPLNWVTECTYTFIDAKTLKCVVTGDGQGTLIYTKKK